MPSAEARKVRKKVSDAYEQIRRVMEALDPIKHPVYVFEPSNPNVAGRIVGIALVAQPRRPLATVDRFYGSGVYALYYKGAFDAYSGIKGKEHPIYVGKADPANSASKTAMEQGERLSSRLNEHRKNILKARGTLSIEDFEYRALVVQTGYQTAAESFLIHLFKPVWNKEMGICLGFGKHGDDPKTRANLRSPWDTLHPGREWAHRDALMKDAKSMDQIKRQIRAHFEKEQPFTSVDDILKRFLEEMRELASFGKSY